MSDLMSVKTVRKTFAALAALGSVLFCIVPDALAQPAAQGNDVRVVVYVIEASQGVPGVDAEIRHIVKQFHETFRYSTYKLVKKAPRKVPMDGQTKITLPGLRELNVYALGYEAGRIQLKVKIVDKSDKGRPRDVLNTEFKLAKGGTIVIGGYDYQKGKLILAISADM